MNTSRRYRILVVDDEPMARNGLCALLTADPDVDVVGACGDGRQAVAHIRELEPDIVFLDVQMPGLSGFDVLREIEAELVPTIVFVTAFDQYALKAFDAHAIDYLLKPFEDERFQIALERAKRDVRLNAAEDATDSLDTVQQSLHGITRQLARLLDASEGTTPTAVSAPVTRLVVRDNGRIRFVRTTDLVWIEAADYYVKLHVAGKVHMLRESMTSLGKRLDAAHFFRVHRSALVNLDHVREIQPFGRGEYVVLLDNGTRLRLAQSRREELARRLGERL